MRDRIKKILTTGQIGEILRKGGLSLFSRVFSNLVSFAFFIYVTRNYGKDAMGLFQLSNSILVISALLVSLGFQKSIVRFASRLSSENNLGKLHQIVVSILKRVTPLALILGLVFILFSRSLSMHVFKDASMQICLMLLGIALPFFVIYWIGTEFLRGLNKFKQSEILKFAALWLPTTLICYFLTRSNQEIYIPFLAYIITICLLFLYIILSGSKVLRSFKNIEDNQKEQKFDFSYYLKTSLPMIVTSLSFILLIRMDLVMLGIFENVSIGELGIYGIAVKLGVLTNFGNQALQRMSAPRISEYFWAKRDEKLKNLIFNIKRINLLISLPVCLMIFLFSKELLSIFGEEFVDSEGILVMRIIAIAYFINAYFGLAGVFMNMTGNQVQFMYIIVGTIVLNLILNLILIPKMGILGPALSTCLCFFLWNIFTTIYLFRKYKIKMYYMPFISKN